MVYNIEYNTGINAEMIKGFMLSLQNFGFKLVEDVMNLDQTAILILAGIIIFFSYIVYKVTSFIWSFLRRFVLTIIIFTSTYLFILKFYDKIFTNPDLLIIFIGALGLLLGIIATYISFVSVGKTLKPIELEEIIEKPREEQGKEKNEKEKEKEVGPSLGELGFYGPPYSFSRENLIKSVKTDKSLLAVLSYLIITEFGIISSVTISAQNPEIGLVFFAFFILAALIFIKNTYQNHLKGVIHLIAASIIGFFVSVILAYFWISVPILELLSFNYFKTPALVALVSGLGVSLLLGTKER